MLGSERGPPRRTYARHQRNARVGALAVAVGILAAVAALPFAATRAQDVQGDPLAALFGDLPSDPQALADAVVEDVVAIRGLELKEPISVVNRSVEDFEIYPDDRRLVRIRGLWTKPLRGNLGVRPSSR